MFKQCVDELAFGHPYRLIRTDTVSDIRYAKARSSLHSLGHAYKMIRLQHQLTLWGSRIDDAAVFEPIVEFEIECGNARSFPAEQWKFIHIVAGKDRKNDKYPVIILVR